jgi:3-deoxy-D-manno-octulosonic-acid transferase
VPVIFGPNNQRFQEAQELKAAGGGFDIQQADDFTRLMDRFDSDATYLQTCGQQAGDYVESRAGATKRILADLKL